jgi:DNA-binding MarR family transcriptional regulator
MASSRTSQVRAADRSLVDAVRALARLARILERASSHLSLAQYRVLSAVSSGDERATRVAQRLELGKPTVSAAVEALCRSGYLDRSVETADQRAMSLRVTEAGRSVLDEVEAEMVRRIEDLCARTPDGAQVQQSLTWIGIALDQMAAERAAGREAVL